MDRAALMYLQKWLEANDRKPLVIRGARQVGKTWLVRHLAEISGKQLIEINFEQTPQFADLFATNDPQQIITNIEAALNITIVTKQSILFLDEIQTKPELLSKLRWFFEEMPQLPVITAGSLLEFVLAEHKFSMPVGRISYLHLEPLSFEEFLLAKDQTKLYELIQNFQWHDNIPAAIHTKLLDLFKQYIIVGGLPAVVSSWIQNNSLEKISQLHHDLLTTYRDDFAKYAGKVPIARLDEILAAIPNMLGEKFVYSRVNKDVQTASLKNALQLLTKARLCHQVMRTSANGIPLAAGVNLKFFKVIGLDVGLISAALGLGLHQINNITDITLINKGGIAEQAVGQLLRTVEPAYVEPRLHYWAREQKGAEAELDYLLQHQTGVIPIEVKSGNTGTLKSLHLFMHLKQLSTAIRISSTVPSSMTINAKTHIGENVSYQLLSIPFYLVGQVHRLLQQSLQ